MPKWYCTDCDDIFTDESGARCLSCGFRRVVGPLRYCNRAEVQEALYEGAPLDEIVRRLTV